MTDNSENLPLKAQRKYDRDSNKPLPQNVPQRGNSKRLPRPIEPQQLGGVTLKIWKRQIMVGIGYLQQVHRIRKMEK